MLQRDENIVHCIVLFIFIYVGEFFVFNCVFVFASRMTSPQLWPITDVYTSKSIFPIIRNTFKKPRTEQVSLEALIYAAIIDVVHDLATSTGINYLGFLVKW